MGWFNCLGHRFGPVCGEEGLSEDMLPRNCECYRTLLRNHGVMKYQPPQDGSKAEQGLWKCQTLVA